MGNTIRDGRFRAVIITFLVRLGRLGVLVSTRVQVERHALFPYHGFEEHVHGGAHVQPEIVEHLVRLFLEFRVYAHRGRGNARHALPPVLDYLVITVYAQDGSSHASHAPVVQIRGAQVDVTGATGTVQAVVELSGDELAVIVE